MIYSIKQLRELSDESLVEEHDKKAKNTVVGTQYYLDELNRRSRERNESAMFKLTIVSTVASILAIAVSAIAIMN